MALTCELNTQLNGHYHTIYRLQISFNIHHALMKICPSAKTVYGTYSYGEN